MRPPPSCRSHYGWWSQERAAPYDGRTRLCSGDAASYELTFFSCLVSQILLSTLRAAAIPDSYALRAVVDMLRMPIDQRAIYTRVAMVCVLSCHRARAVCLFCFFSN
uniref:Uncharacterized protein n=1 Tax=Prymnesium polylepis TaxID=72548 RepID=A0A7S4IZ48_9EUKA|eukprot:111247-Prymnesium_polylepis.2